MRYESCETTLVTWFCASDSRNAFATSEVTTGSRHWQGVLVKIWIAVAPISAARAGAV